MPKRKPLQVDLSVHEIISQQAETFDITLKQYAEASLLFFASRGINPTTYQPGKEFDTIQILKKSTDRIIDFIKHQEQTLLQKITEEVVRGRLYQDALIFLLVEQLVEPASRDERLKEIVEYVENTMHKAKNA